MDSPEFLHAAHQVRNAFDGLRLVSWLAIGLAVGALVLTWGRLLSWLRTPDAGESPRLISWRAEGEGFAFQVEGGDGVEWSVVDSDGGRALLNRAADGVLRGVLPSGRPVALISSGGERLTL